MSDKFDYFVIFAEMRTGSNFLEANLNAFDDITCYGEAFNPHFIGYPNKSEILGVTQAMRDADPAQLIQSICKEQGVLGGFRLFSDHDPRAIEHCLNDLRCAKIILTRNPVDCYISWKIAQATGQWKLTNVKRRKDSKITFDRIEFEKYFSKLQSFQIQLLNQLQSQGQAAFYVTYEDLQSLDVVNGLARYLGVESKLDALDTSLKRQNPGLLQDKVSNYADMERALSGQDTFNLSRTPNFEPRRGPAVPGFITGATTPLLYMPVRSGPEKAVTQWLAALDGVETGGLPTKLSQKQVRQWKRRNKLHRSFTVLRHPVRRAHAAFCDKILSGGPDSYADIRKTLKNFYKLPIPGGKPDESYDRDAHRAAFIGFLEFLQANLLGQTNIRIDAHWSTQTAVLQGMAQFSTPDVVIREEEMQDVLSRLTVTVGREDAIPAIPVLADDTPVPLDEIYDAKIETLVRGIYQRDYLMFGFGRWK